MPKRIYQPIKFILSKIELENEYNILGSLSKIAIKYNVARQTVTNRFIKLKIPYKSKKHKFSSNEDFFLLENEKSFYWAGFVAADGCLYKRKDGFKQLTIKLASKDKNHLESFKKDIETNAPISLYKNHHRNEKWNDTEQYQLRIASHKIFDSINKFGITPRKTKTYDLPDQILLNKFFNHFLRGYFDGDGCICKSINWSWSMRGTLSFLNKCKNILELNCNLKSKVSIRLSNGTWELRYTGRKMVSKIIQYLYKDATVYLDRKYQIAQQSRSL